MCKIQDLPVLCDIGQIVPDNWPSDFGNSLRVSIGDQPLCVSQDCNSPQSRPISLRTAPCASELSEVDIELGLS